MTLHTYALSRDRPGDFGLMKAIARIHLAAWLTIPLMQTIMYRPEITNPANRARYLKRDTDSLRNEDQVRFVVVIDDELSPDEDDVVDEGEQESDSPKGRVVAAIKYYLVPSTGPHPDSETQVEIDKQSGSSIPTDDDTARVGDSNSTTSNMNHALSDIFVAELVAARQEATKIIGTHVLIDNLYTDPAHHRRGAGGMLMRVAVQHADEIGWPSMLEASPLGMKVYESVGFEVLEGKDIWIDLKRWDNGGDKGPEFSERRLVEVGGMKRIEDGWYAQMIMVRPARSKRMESV